MKKIKVWAINVLITIYVTIIIAAISTSISVSSWNRFSVYLIIYLMLLLAVTLIYYAEAINRINKHNEFCDTQDMVKQYFQSSSVALNPENENDNQIVQHKINLGQK